MLVNIVDVPPLCNFILPAIVRTGPLAIAISTAGASPALAKRIKRQVADEFGEEYARLAVLLNEVRGWAKGTLPTYQDRKAFFEGIVNGEPDPIALLRAGDEAAVRDLIAAAQRSHAPRRRVIDLDDVRRAAARLDGVAHRTPVVTSRTLDERTGATVRLKPENLQRIGAFKFRGAYNTRRLARRRGARPRRRDRLVGQPRAGARALGRAARRPRDDPHARGRARVQGGRHRGLRRADRALRPLHRRPRGADGRAAPSARARRSSTPTTTSGSWPARAPRRSS